MPAFLILAFDHALLALALVLRGLLRLASPSLICLCSIVLASGQVQVLSKLLALLNTLIKFFFGSLLCYFLLLDLRLLLLNQFSLTFNFLCFRRSLLELRLAVRRLLLRLFDLLVEPFHDCPKRRNLRLLPLNMISISLLPKHDFFLKFLILFIGGVSLALERRDLSSQFVSFSV